MDIQQQIYKNKMVITEEEEKGLIIKNIYFTNREIDTIACLLGGRSTKKIAAFLTISPKTVENHIRNIMLKITCNSREQIIDFIENTDKFVFIKKHYSDLLIKNTFKHELKKISAQTKKYDLNCIIFHYKKQKVIDPFIKNLQEHLNLAGIKTISKIWEPGKTKNHLINAVDTKQINCVIYNLSNEFIEYLQIKNYNISVEASNLFNIVKNQCVFIFLLAENKCPTYFHKKSSSFNYINLAEQENYYLLVFQILQKLLPANCINKNIIAFKKEGAAFFDHSLLQRNITEITKDNEQKEIIFNHTNKHSKKQTVLLGGIVITLIFICTLGLAFKQNLANFVFKHTKNETETLKFTKLNALSPQTINIISLNLPARNNKFIERENDIKQITDQLNKQKNGMAIKVISGIGGIGKTQLAIEFAHRAKEENNYGAILWITAETYYSINNSYRKFSDGLQIHTKELNLTEIQNLVHLKLIERFNGSKILFVLDNVANNTSIKNYLEVLQKQLTPYITPHVLITSRSQDWIEDPLLLDVFTPAETEKYIKMYLPNEKVASIDNLGKILNYFPLALNQSLAYIKAHSNIDDYLEAYLTKKENYLNKFQGNDNQYVESLWKIWNIGLSKLSKNARKILYISAYLDQEDISLDFFNGLTSEERMLAIGELREHSFIILSNNNKSFKIHKLLQEVIRLTIRLQYPNHIKKDLWLNESLNLIENKFDFNYLQVDNWRNWSKYLSHARTIAEHAIKTKGNASKRGFKLYSKVAMFMTHILMEPENSIAIWIKLLQLVEDHHDNHYNALLVAKINTYLGIVNRWNNNPNEAKIALDKAINVYLQTNNKTTREIQELINILRLIPLPNTEKLSNAIKYDLGYALTQLGKLYSCSLGKYNKALFNYNKALAIFKNIKDSPKTVKQAQAFTYMALAMFNNRIGDFQKADTLFVESLHIMSSFLPEKHYLINAIKVNIGANAYMLEDIKRAKTILQKAVSYKYALNTSHSQWLSKFYLGRIYENLGKYERALIFFNNSLAMVENHYQETLHNFTQFHISRAEFWSKMEKNSTITYWQEALAFSSKLFGEKHYQTARYHFLLGQAFANKKEMKQAEKQYKLAMNILKTEKIKYPELVKFHQQNLQITKELLILARGNADLYDRN